MPIEISYISLFLSRNGVEGLPQTRGYIPCWNLDAKGQRIAKGDTYESANYRGEGLPSRFQAMGASGVTIGVGVDLGQTTADTMLDYGLESGIVNALRPYFGLKRDAAIAKLHSLPLTVSIDTAHAITQAVHNGYLRYVVSAYDKESRVAFAGLPKQAQAVTFSLCYQKGCTGVRTEWPKVWGHLVRQDWRAASNELITGFKQYAGRRKIEGELLREIC